MTVKINNRSYAVPEFGFKQSRTLEQCGVSLRRIVDQDSMFTIANAFVCIVVNCTPDMSDELIEQHILGGGNLEEIFDAYTKAISDSHFFKKLLETEEKKAPVEKVVKSVKKVSEK